ncbi:hypothetical protein SK128_002580 [Halocaridina rubra]|uniref:Uncharacterized protein n=1 Tax=Halocaridina rubra TaxID=373956 RepID=A0AAN8WKC9_HALRR
MAQPLKSRRIRKRSTFQEYSTRHVRVYIGRLKVQTVQNSSLTRTGNMKVQNNLLATVVLFSGLIMAESRVSVQATNRRVAHTTPSSHIYQALGVLELDTAEPSQYDHVSHAGAGCLAYHQQDDASYDSRLDYPCKFNSFGDSLASISSSRL